MSVWIPKCQRHVIAYVHSLERVVGLLDKDGWNDFKPSVKTFRTQTKMEHYMSNLILHKK